MIRVFGSIALWALAAHAGLAGLAGLQVEPAFAGAAGLEDDYVSTVEAERHEADEKFRSDIWSPLAVVAMERLGETPVVLGSGPDANLVLEGSGVAARHAEVVPESADGSLGYRLRALDGALYTESDPESPIDELWLEEDGARVRVGRYIIYYDVLATLGPILRVLDFETPAYQKFDGLDYFPVDRAYRVEAHVERYPEPVETEIIDTMGFASRGWLYGEASFQLLGEALRLKLVLFTEKPGPDARFYVMFTDETNGKETYGACRYILPTFTDSDTIVLDFNRAVNPSCAYSPGFACPLPPRGNHIPFEVRAGVKDYPHGPGH
ncbi:MAG: hypothetical protein BMS9Abin37_3224 [Acidobacteriota bacterium]|nr:MAG: hypothetical protein BMS9Abin37_3224 [Acidobacteriota bacterium]